MLTRSRAARAALQDFAAVQRETLRIWTEDMAAQISEYLTEKYPGQNMSRAANGFMQRFTHTETLAQSRGKSLGRGVSI